MTGMDRVRAAARRAPLVLGGAALTAFGVATLAFSAWLHLQQPVGRRAFGDMMGAAVSAQIPGTLRVEGVRVARLPHVEVDHVRAFTAGGMEVMDLRDASVDFHAWRSLRHAGAHIRRASVGGGVIQVAISPSGKPWIERAFSASDEGSQETNEESQQSGGGSGGPFWTPSDREILRIEDTSFEDLRLLVEAGDRRARLVDAEGQARIWLPAHEDVQMRYWGVSGVVHTSSSFLREAPVRGFALTLDPKSAATIRFATQLDAYDAELTLAGQAPGGDGNDARICLWTGGAPMASLMGIGGEVATSLFTGVSLDMRPSEPPDDPRCPAEGS